MKLISSISFLIIMLVQTFSVYIINADYLLNKNYITKSLCENREKPKMQCQGKCYLAKKIKSVETQEQQTPTPKKQKIAIQLFFAPTEIFISHSTNLLETLFTNRDKYALASYARFIFHPPGF